MMLNCRWCACDCGYDDDGSGDAVGDADGGGWLMVVDGC